MSKKALLVDDHDIFRKMVKRMLPPDFEPVEAVNGKEALEVLDKNPDIVIILADVNMPEMDGFAMVEVIKAEGKYTGPIVFLSSERDQELIDRANSLGIEDWLPKPFKKDALQAVIAKHI